MAGDDRQDVDISTGKGIGGAADNHATQTRDGEPKPGSGDAKPGDGADDGAGKPGGGTGDGSGEGDAFAADKDGKYLHPETKQPVDAAELARYYHGQFGNSTRGAQDLLTKNKTLEGERDTAKGLVAKLETDLAKMKEIAEGKNPEGVNLADLEARYKETATELALIKENAALDGFEKAVPLATTKREALRSLARANPAKSLQELWDANLKAGAEAEKVAADAKAETQRKAAGEKGKGTSTREPARGGDTVRGNKGDTGLMLAEFNKLPVNERRALMEKFDIR